MEILEKKVVPKLRFKDENGNEYPEWEEAELKNYIDRFELAIDERTAEAMYAEAASQRAVTHEY